MKSHPLNDAQRRILADIGIAIGQLSAASMILPFVIPGLDASKVSVILLGLLFTIGAWLFSFYIVRKRRR